MRHGAKSRARWHWAGGVAGLGIVLLLAALPPTAAHDARIVSITETATLPVMRPDTPVPDDPGQVLYLQRSTNRNTVVYAARFDGAGRLDPWAPVAVYWRRYEEVGQIRALKVMEREFAYGLRVRPGVDPGSYRISFRAVPGMEMTLRQDAPFAASLHGSDGTRDLRLRYGYVNAIDGLIPQVVEVRMFGTLSTGRHATVVLRPN